MDKIVNLERNLEMWNNDVEGVNIINEDESDGEEEIFFDSDYDMEEDDKIFDLFVDHGEEFVGVEKEKYDAMNELIDEDLYAKLQAEDGDFGCVGSEDEFASNDGSDDENTMKYPMHNPRTDGKNPELELGLIFSSKDEAKFSIESHCLRRGMMVKFVKNDRIRLRAVCRNEGCDWFVYVSKMQNDNSWQIKSSCLLHNQCSWNVKNPSLKSGWIAKTFVKKLKENPKLDTLQFRREVCKTMKADVTKSQAYRARKKAKQLLDGKMEEQFNKIWDYCEEIQRTNPGSTVIMKLLDEEGSQQKRFHRFYMCLNACKLGFKNSCRPIIGVDGCFLKGRYGGQLLTAVGVDPNNQHTEKSNQ